MRDWKQEFNEEFTRDDKDDPYKGNVFEDPETIIEFIESLLEAQREEAYEQGKQDVAEEIIKDAIHYEKQEMHLSGLGADELESYLRAKYKE